MNLSGGRKGTVRSFERWHEDGYGLFSLMHALVSFIAHATTWFTTYSTLAGNPTFFLFLGTYFALFIFCWLVHAGMHPQKSKQHPDCTKKCMHDGEISQQFNSSEKESANS